MTEALNHRILSDVIAAIRHALCLSDVSISAATRLVEDLGLDSLDLVDVWMELEAKFHTELPDDFGGRCQSVSQIALYLSQCYFQDAPEAAPEPETDFESEADFALAA
jgi:acyl carrier protein